jgi:hypothetical protein
MGYLGDFYVRAKSFEILSEIGTCTVVLLGTPSVGWMLKTVELIGGDNLRDFRRFFLSG